MSPLMVMELIHRVASGSAASAWLAREEGQPPFVLQAMRTTGERAMNDASFLRAALDGALERQHPSLLSTRTIQTLRDGLRFLYSEPVSGRTAASVLAEEGAVPPTTALRWVITVCDALGYLHARGLVHGNLAPRHLHLVGDASGSQVKLLDTGLIHYRGTRSVAVGGELVEPEYLAPERVLGQRGAPSADIYGVGVMLFELVTGVACFRRASKASSRQAHLEETAPRLIGALEPLDEVVRTCLEKEPLRRFRSVAELGTAAQAVLERLR